MGSCKIKTQIFAGVLPKEGKLHYDPLIKAGLERPQKLLLQSHPEINVIPPGPCAGLFWIHLLDLSSTIRSVADFCTAKHELMRDGANAI